MNRILRAKLIVTQLAKEFPHFYGTGMSIAELNSSPF